MKIIRDGKEIELTQEEMRAAWEETEDNYRKDDLILPRCLLILGIYFFFRWNFDSLDGGKYSSCRKGVRPVSFYIA